MMKNKVFLINFNLSLTSILEGEEHEVIHKDSQYENQNLNENNSNKYAFS
jgi:hypothetical protein